MNKPIVFFSHSSSDKATLKRLKELFTLKTGSSIDVFLSSDGQSIPLGRNWVHRIQESLNEAKLMMVFLTPNSIKSNWVYFESGYAYSKNIRVIPVGFLGFDLNQLHPPLSLLQGFNINSEEGLNNIVAIVNEEFSHKHELSFSNEDYNSIIYQSPDIFNNVLGEITSLIDNILFELNEGRDFVTNRDSLYDELAITLKKQIPDCQVGDNQINYYGVSITKSSSKLPESITFQLDPILINENIYIIEESVNKIRKDGLKGICMRFDFNIAISRLKNIHKITARIYKSEIKLADNDQFVFRNIQFEIGSSFYFNQSKIHQAGVYINITFIENKICVSDIKDLFNILFTREILFISDISSDY